MAPMRDDDPIETREWRRALNSMLASKGSERVQFLLEELSDEATRQGTSLPHSATMPCLNTIRLDREERHPGDCAIERSVRSFIRWNPLATVLRADKTSSEWGATSPRFSSRPRFTGASR